MLFALLATATACGAAQAEPAANRATPSPIWLSTPSTQATGLAQPSSVTPGALPYPTTHSRPQSGAIVQPQFVSPSLGKSDDRAIISDNARNRTAVSPPPLSMPFELPQQTAPISQVSPTPTVAAPPAKKTGFWEFVLGPNQPPAATADPFLAAKQHPTSQVAAAQRRTTTPPPISNSAPSGSTVGGSLWNQLLGTNSPPPQTAASAAPALRSAPLANPLVAAAAQFEVANDDELAARRQPTLRDIEAARQPATSMTISRPGMPPQAGVPIVPSGETPPGMVGAPTVPTLPTQALATAASELWQPFNMTTDAPTAAMPVAAGVPTNTVDRTAQLPESERVPSLLRPFYATNPPPPTGQAGASTAVAASAAPQSITDALAQSSLGRQLTLNNTEDLRTPMTASIDAQVKRSQEPWDGRVTVQWPLMANPFTITNAPLPPQPAGQSIAQAAFLQEPLPNPTGGGAAPDALPNSSDDEPANVTGEKNDENETLAGARTIGTAPQDTSLEFLRTQTVLLEPGKHQFDIGLEYTLTENNFPILITDGMGNVVGVDDVEFKGRELTVPMELRYGLLQRVQGFVQVPVGWANVQAAINNYDEYENDGGVGDIGFGLTAQLRDAYKDRPYIIGTLAGLAPTGGDPFGVFGAISPNAPSLGNGFWAISGNLLWVQTRYDPVVVFYGLGARYQFEREFIGIEFQPGMEYNYTLGTGFAVNERVTLSTQFFGSFIEELKADGERVEGTIQEPMNIRFAATLAKPCNRLVEPFVVFGLTDDSISANVGVTWTY